MYKIAITGKANTGKDTLSKMITKELRAINSKYMVAHYLAFADPIKEMIRIMFPKTPRKFLYGSSKYRNEIIPGAFKDGEPLTIRQLLIDIGTDMGRALKETVWLDNFDHRFAKIPYSKLTIVTDVRFRNEFDHLKKQNFYQIRLYRQTDQPGINHISETNQNFIKDNEFDYVLHNNGTLKDLKSEVAKIVSQLKP